MNGVEIWEKVYKILLFGKISRTKVNAPTNSNSF